MTKKPANLFEVLDPPSGGLARLRERIESDSRRRRSGHVLQAAFATAVLIAAAIVIQPYLGHPVQPLQTGFSPTGVRWGLTAEPAEPLSISSSSRAEWAALRVPLADDRVVFYRVATTAAEK